MLHYALNMHPLCTVDLRKKNKTRRILSLHNDRFSSIENPHSRPIRTLELDKQEYRYLLSASQEGNICIYDTVENCSLSTVNASQEISSGGWFVYDTGLFFTAGLNIVLWDTNFMRPAMQFNFQDCVVHQAKMSQDLKIAAGTSSGEIAICDIRSGIVSHHLYGHRGDVSSIDWHPLNFNYIASGSFDKTIRIWDIRMGRTALIMNAKEVDIESGNSVTYAHDESVKNVCFSNSGLVMYSSALDRSICAWNSTTGERIKPLQIESRMKGSYSSINVCLDDQFLFLPSRSDVFIYDLENDSMIHSISTIADISAVLFEEHREFRIWTGDKYGNIVRYDSSTEENIRPVVSLSSEWID
jgi:WD40 repeat protein